MMANRLPARKIILPSHYSGVRSSAWRGSGGLHRIVLIRYGKLPNPFGRLVALHFARQPAIRTEFTRRGGNPQSLALDSDPPPMHHHPQVRAPAPG